MSEFNDARCAGGFPTTGDGVAVGIGATVWRANVTPLHIYIDGCAIDGIGGEQCAPTISGRSATGRWDRMTANEWYSTPEAALKAARAQKGG